MYESLALEVSDGVAVVTLNRPQALNALNSTVFAELAAFLDSVETDDSVRCLVLTGSAKAFAAANTARSHKMQNRFKAVTTAAG